MKVFLLAFAAGLAWCVWAGLEVCGVVSWSKPIMDFWKSPGLGETVFVLCVLMFVWQSVAWFVSLFRRPNIRRGDLRPDGSTF